jgi:hypothetical protein
MIFLGGGDVALGEQVALGLGEVGGLAEQAGGAGESAQMEPVSRPIPSATTQQCSPKCTPSITNATRSSPDRSALISSARTVSVAATIS